MGRSIRNRAKSQSAFRVAAGTNVTVNESNGVYTVNSTASGSGGSGLTNWTEDANGHLIPNNNAQYDIGSAEKKVQHLYLSQNSLYMGSGDNVGTAISLDGSGDLTVGGTKLIKGDAEGKVPTDKMPTNVTSVVASGDGDNVLSSLQVGGTTYTLPSSGSGGGGGTSVTANPSLSGNEANLTSLTVGATSYKVGTSINALSYSDTSKLLLSYPFSLASDQAGTSTNYGSLTPSSTNNTAVYESNVGLRFTSDAADNNDIFNVTIPTGLTSSFTAYVKYKQAQVPSGNENEYERYPRFFIYQTTKAGRPFLLVMILALKVAIQTL